MLIGVVIITYNPEIELFFKVIESLINQFEKICIVDNGSKNLKDIKEITNNEKIELIPIYSNEGIAKATNIGLHYFQQQKFDFVITSDQDSVYPEKYYQAIEYNYNYFKDDLKDIAAFCPIFYDENIKKEGQIVKKTKFYMKKTYLSNDFEDVFETIASGLVINLQNLDEIGYMDEALFIDWVDFEWCWRAFCKQKRIICCKNMMISHRLGEGSKKIGTKNISIHSYIRNYYITRNAFYLATHTKFLTRSAKIIIFLKSFQYIIVFPLISKNFLKNIIYTNKGLIDGLKGKLGKIN